MNRITRKNLDACAAMLNRITDSPLEPYEGSHGAWKAQPGNFHISGAYGGYAQQWQAAARRQSIAAGHESGSA